MLAGLLLPAGAFAQTVPPRLVTPVAWPSTLTWQAFVYNGAPVRDPEGGKSTDSSNGGASFSAESDLSSGWFNKNPVNHPCNPLDPASSQCGTETTMWWAYYDNGTTWDPYTEPSDVNGSTDMLDDVLFFRMRVDGDPRETGQSTNRLNNNHWNFLHDVDNDGYKEFWFDVFGNDDIVRILYENNNSQQITNELQRLSTSPCQSPLGTWLDTLVSCADLTGTTASGYSCQYSHTRAVQIPGTEGATPGTTEWFVDLQIPLQWVRVANDGCEPTILKPPGWLSGCPSTNLYCYLVEPISPRRFVYSTSDSSVDPLQKDYTPGCNTVGGVITTCNYTEATPVTLASFQATGGGGRYTVKWTTSTETGNAGFNLYAKVAGSWMQVNTQLIASKVVDSLSSVQYTYPVRFGGAEAFAIEDVDVNGKRRWHGEFEIGRTYGFERKTPATDWQSVSAEHAAKAAARKAQRKADAETSVKAAKAGTASFPVYELKVDSDGLYRVSYEQLAAAGLDLAGVSTSRIGLTNRGIAVPIRVEVSSGRSFGPGGFIEFYGEKIDSYYTQTNVYRLVVDSRSARSVRSERAAPSRRAAVVTSYVEHLEVENDNAWSWGSPNGDPWYDQEIFAYTSPVSVALPITTDNLLAGGGSVSVDVWGMTNWFGSAKDHHVSVSLNGTLVGDTQFDGQMSAPMSFAVPSGVLLEGDNTVTVTVPGDTGYAYEIVALDGYGVSYPRQLVARNGSLQFTAVGDAFRVSGLPSADVVAYRLGADGAAARLDGFDVARDGATWTVTFAGDRRESTYVVASTSALLSPAIEPPPPAGGLTTGPAQYLIVSHPDFAADLAPLVAAREAQGLSVKVVETDSIYSAFGDGIFGAQPLQEYIAWAIQHLGTEYVLLVGGDSFDYMDRLGFGSMSFVPTLYMETEALVRFTPVDGPLADVDGDFLPDAAIGRFPVKTSGELAGLIDKTLNYSSTDRRAVFAAGLNESSGRFTDISDRAIATLPLGWQAERAYMDTLGVGGAKAKIIDEINAGAALTHFMGHSDLDIWTWDGLFSSGDAATLVNAGDPTIVVQWGCWNSYFVRPDVRSLAEVFLNSGDRGAAAVIGPSGRTSVDGDAEMSLRLTDKLLQPGMSIGQALTTVKHEIRAINPTLADVFWGVNLLGDPALVMVP